MRKQVVFIANTLESAHKFQKVFAELKVDVTAGPSVQMDKLFGQGAHPDLVVLEAPVSTESRLEEAIFLIEDLECSLLLIVDEETFEWLQIPEVVSYDFVMRDAGPVECMMRVRRLLGDGQESGRGDVITVGNMTINLATYQVSIAGELVDFTYLEYALLSFLVRHPNRTFSREALLQNVWGVDYFGGPRTVDVHVRRVRAKIGPKLAQHLETVRGVGYLWRNE